ncbi:MAG: BON domain-containing protein [Acidobacteriota bacterium]|jgi:osmotically-inducible protein OsmY
MKAALLTLVVALASTPSIVALAQETTQPQPAAPASREEALASDIRAALAEHFADEAQDITVQVSGNRAVLLGSAPRKAVAELAKEVALWVPGITRVSNYIDVRPRPASPDTPVAATVAHAEREVSDSALESRVKMRLASLLGLRARQVEVEASEGWVSLRGVLPDADTKAMVLRVAQNTPGVARVIDLLRNP